MFILRKHVSDRRERRFVAPAGLHHSYTARREDARKFSTREAAEANACGNETVVRLIG